MNNRIRASVVACILGLLFLSTLPTRADVVEFKKVKKDGNMEWVGGTVICWKNILLDCLRTPPPSENFTITPFGGGFLLSVIISDMSAWPVSDPENVQTISGANHTFDESIEMRIVSCTAHPQLVGRTVNLGGLTTTPGRSLTVYIP